MKILVTGGAGFIGSHVVEHFQGKAEVVVLDDFRTGHRSNLAGLSCQLIEGSILDHAPLARALAGVSHVYHLAAMISVPESIEQPAACERLNTEGTRCVLAAALRAGAQKVILASSAAIYGDNPLVPKVETMSPEPKSPYASTKLAGEQLLEAYRLEQGLGTTSLRFFNVFGPRQDPRSAYAAAVPIFVAKALRGEPITVYGDGEQTRDFVYVKDIVEALAYAARHEAMAGVYNVGYGHAMTIRALAEEVIRLTGSASRLEFVAERPGDIKHSCASAARLRSTGWIPHYDVKAGLAATIDYFRSLKA